MESVNIVEGTVQVKRKHIKEGHPCSPGSCPVALAILSRFPQIEASSIGVSGESIHFFIGSH